MDLSITDLLVKNEAPAGGLRGLAPGAGGSITGTSIAAFNDLLDQYASRPRPEAPSRDAGRPAASERTGARDDAEGIRRSERDRRTPRDDAEAAPSDTPETVAPSDADAKAAVKSHGTAERPAEPAPGDASAKIQVDGATPAQVLAPTVATTDVQPSSATEPAVPEQTTPAVHRPALSDLEPGAAVAQSRTNASPAAPKTTANPQANAAAHVVQAAHAQGVGTDDGAAESLFAAAASAKGGQAGATAQTKAPIDVPGHTSDHASAALLRAASVSVEEARIGGAPRSQLPPGLLIAQEVANGKGIAHAIEMAGGNPGASGQASNGQATTGTAAIAQQGQHGATTAALQVGQSEIELPAPVPAPAGLGLTPTGSATLPGNGGGHGQVHGISMHGPLHTTTPGAGGAASQAAASARAPQPIPVPLDQVSVHIAKAAASGSDHISIKLKPAALGQVDVKLELTHDGRVTAVVTVDRADTLDMLQRDAKGLEKALHDAGLKTDSDSLQFNLRGDGQAAARHDGGTGRPPHAPAALADTADDAPAAASQSDYVNRREASGGIDISV